VKIRLLRSTDRINGKYIYGWPCRDGGTYSIRWDIGMSMWRIKSGNQQWHSRTLDTVRSFIADKEGIQS
jgi:hypothetical protein